MTWQPPPRGPWVEKLAATGRALGDDGRSIVPLSAEDLMAAAVATSGLDDFGDEWFREPLERLTTSMEEEAHLHLAGRIRARAELQTVLQNRLALVDLWKREPVVLDVDVAPPIVVTGLGRSGTTLLHELLACDPANRPPLLWELLYSVPPPTRAADVDDERAGWADEQITLMDEMVPSLTGMHENRGHWPTECIFAFMHQFSSDQFVGLYDIPGYTIWRSGLDHGPIYQWHRQMLQTLQSQAPTERWLLKAPSHLTSLAYVFATYPDARVVVTHRDPLRVVGSLADLMATLRWMHSDRVDHPSLIEFLAMGLEMQMDHVSAQRDAGDLPADRITDVRYTDLVADPVGCVAGLYDQWGIALTDDVRARLEAYVAERHTGRDSAHDYRWEDTGLELAEHRPLVQPYQDRFGVQSEVF
jgi:hypothetical protein